MRILVTGATGFLGQAAVRRLSRDGHEVFAAAETSRGVQEKLGDALEPGRAVGFDLSDPRDIRQAMRAIRPKGVLHLGARSEVALSFDNWAEVSAVNYVGAIAMAEEARLAVPDFRLFLFASTMETYGRAIGPNEHADEGTEQLPMAPYAVAKVGVEKYLDYMRHAYGFRSLALRQTNTYGRHDNDFFIMERVITQMLRGPEVRLGADWPERNFLYVDDLMELYSRAFANTDAADAVEVSTIGPPNALPIHALAGLCAEVLGWSGEVVWDTVPERPGEIARLSSVVGRVGEAFGWEPRVGLREGIALTADKWRGRV